MSESVSEMPVMHAPAAGLMAGGSLCGVRAQGEGGLWLGEWFLVTCQDCPETGTSADG